MRLMILAATLLTAATPARADRVPDPFAPAAWLGTYQLQATARYSTCKQVAVGDVEILDFTISISKGQWVGRERNQSSGRSASFTSFLQPQLPPAVAFRSGTQIGLDLWLTDAGIAGRRVVAMAALSGCAIVYDLTGSKAGASPRSDPAGSRAKIGGIDDLSLSDLDPNEIAQVLRIRYLAGIQRCHQRVLKADPRAKGRINIRFTVGPEGRVTKASVKGFDPTLDSCVEGQAHQWRFRAPKNSGRPTSAEFAVPLMLEPGE